MVISRIILAKIEKFEEYICRIQKELKGEKYKENMKGIFSPNGVGSLKIINQLAKKEFGNEIGTANSYVEL